MKRLVRRFSALSRLRRKWMLVPTFVVLALLVTGGLWYLGHAGANSVWNLPSGRISVVLDRVDLGEILVASISGHRILLTVQAGHQPWTIEKESCMGSTDEYLRN